MLNELEQIVQKPTWKQVLLDLIVSEELDPWNIDLIKICNGFLQKVKEMKKMDLFIPANMILASAILLRYKSQVLNFQEHVVQEVMDEKIEEGEKEAKPEIQELKVLARIPPKRPITLNELMTELDKVMEYEEKRGKIKKRNVEAMINIKVEGIDIEKQMDEVYNSVMKQMNGEGFVLFSSIMSKSPEKKEVIYTLLSLLHLNQNKKIQIKQKQAFGEIFISPFEEQKNKN